MPRTRAGTVPKLQHHRATGQARVTIAGRDYYCGRWGSKAAIAKYHRLLGEFFNANGAPPVAEGVPSPPGRPPRLEDAKGPVHAITVGPAGVHVETSRGGESAICVCDVAARYLMHCEIYYRDVQGRQTSTLCGAKMAIRALEPFFDLPAWACWKYSGSRLSLPATPRARSRSRVASLHEPPEKPEVLMLVAPSGETVISIFFSLMPHLRPSR